ncbi:MAG: membrane dipeptidase, partial [Oscillospiraceae bacterium]|nr:membrane dipeptidase [Oscillospiraceae bacterium]
APPEGMFAECCRQQALFARELAQNDDLTVPCRTGEEVKQANDNGKIAAQLNSEGGELLDCDPEKLDWAKQAGVVSVNLTWNHANELSGSHREAPERGLSDRGRAFVRRAGELGIRLDVSHCSDAAFWDLVKLTEQPVIATHSDARAICPHTRNLTDDMFRAIAESGGVVGLNFYTAFVAPSGEPTMDDILRHFDHFLSLGGENHIALGADLDGCSALAGGLRGVEDMPRLWQALNDHGYDENLLEKIFYRNWLRVLW